jgi:CheY-like chemotaxis protein
MFCEALTSISSEIECDTVDNGKSLFDRLMHHVKLPHIIFLDINMPVMNGWECLKRLKENSTYRHIPTVIYSTSSAKRDIGIAYSLGASLFLSKPEDFNDLHKILEIIATTPQNQLRERLAGFRNVKLGEN